MTILPRLSIRLIVATLIAACSPLLSGSLTAQYGSSGRARAYTLPWENNRIRVDRLSVAPNATFPANADRVLVYLTADANGRMPAEAVWQPASSGTVQNSGGVRVDAIAIDLKGAEPVRTEGTPPEALTPSSSGYGSYDTPVQVTTLVDNPRVLVMKHRYPPNTYNGALHFHPQDLIVFYLRGGYASSANALWGLYPVRRGDIDVIPANTLHTLSNPGPDPLELLVILPK